MDQDLNLAAEADLDARAEAIFRSQSPGRSAAIIVVPMNCGAEPLDVVTLTDPRVRELSCRLDLNAGSCLAALDLEGV